MKVFEDILVELQEENLLEETVLLPPKANGNGTAYPIPPSSNGNGHRNGSSSTKRKQPDPYRGALRRDVGRINPSDQMSALQLVEFVVSEAERLDRAAGRPFDDLQVQKALHRYTQSGTDKESDEFLEAESALVESLRSWEEDLVKRDASIPVDKLRRYAESANPPLSPQALFALVRFYRTVPVSENAYLKFDFVVTRLFSKFIDGERREILCPRAEVVKHLNQRYSDWGMNAFKALPADDPDVALVCLSFDDFAAEAERALRISDLFDTKFFDRLNELKRSSGAMSFIPQVTAAAIESNLKISFRLADLIADATKRGGLARLGDVDTESVSNAIARTFEIGTVSEPHHRSETRPAEADTVPAAARPVKPPKAAKSNRANASGGLRLTGVNPWLLLGTILSVIISVGIYVWSEYYTDEPTATSSAVRTVDLEKPDLKQYVKTSKVTGETLYVVVTLKFIELSPDKRRDVVQQISQLGESKGYKRVALYDAEGKTIAYGSADRTDIR